MVGGRGGIVFEHTPGKPSEGMGYTHKEVRRNIRRKYGRRQPSRGDSPVVEEQVEEPISEPRPEVEKTDYRVGQYYTRSAYIQQLEYYASSYPPGERTSQGYKDIQRYISEARDIPSYVNIKRTQEGFSFTVDPVEKARLEWEQASNLQRTGKALWVGMTQWPSTLWESGTHWFTKKPVQQYQKELIAWESMTWGQAKDIHKGKSPVPFLKSTATTPAVIEAATLGVFKGASIAARPVTRWGVRAGVKTFGKLSSFIPDERLVTESGKIVHTSATKRLVSKIGATKTWNTISKWSTGDIVKVRSLPLSKTVRFSDKGLTSRLDIYKGWGKPQWVPKKVLTQATKQETFHIHKIDPFGRYQAFVTEKAYKPSGVLWWKTAKKQITTFSEHQPIVQKSLVDVSLKKPAFLWSGSVKPSSKATIFIKDINAYMTIPRSVHYRPMISTGLHHAGSLTTGSIVAQVPTSSVVSILGAASLSGLITKSELGYKTVYGSPQKYNLDRSQVNISALKPAQVTQSLLLPSQRMKKRSIQTYESILNKTVSSNVIPRSVPFSVHGSARFPFRIPSSDELLGRSKKRKEVFDLFGKGYRYRKWDVPSLEDFI